MSSSALADAIAKNDLPLVQHLLQHQTLPEALWDPMPGETINPFTMACSRGHLEMARWMLTQIRETSVLVNMATEHGETPLLFAAEAGHTSLIALLADAGADLDVTDHFERTPLMMAAKEHQTDALRQLLRLGAGIHFTDIDGINALMFAIEADDQEAMRALIAAGADLDQTDGLGRNAWLTAAASCNMNALRILYEAGVDIHQKTHWLAGTLKNALMLAADNEMATKEAVLQTIDLLLEMGLRLDEQDHLGNTALMLALAACNDTAAIRLLEAGAQQLPNEEGCTPLMMASGAAMPDVIHACIATGADIDARDKHGQTALMQVGMHASDDEFTLRRLQCFKTLVEAGADIHASDDMGTSVLMLYAERGDMELLKEVVRLGGDLYQVDQQGCDACALAEAVGWMEIVDYLRSKMSAQALSFLESH